MKEIWKNVPIKPFNKYYMVSNLGRVKRKSHTTISYYCNGNVYKNHCSSKILKVQTPNKKRKRNLQQKRVVLKCPVKNKAYFVHRLVAKAFIPNPHHYPIINHKDRNESHNWVNNLEWCTYKYNNTYGNSRQRAANGESYPCALIKNDIEYDFLSIPQAAIYLHINLKIGKSLRNIENDISRVCRNEYKHVYGFGAKRLERSVIDDDLY